MINQDKMKKSLSMDMLATDLADYLVRKGVPFRETHHIAGEAVKWAESQNCCLNEIPLQKLKELHSAFESDVDQVWDFTSSVEKRMSLGGTSQSNVLLQIQQLKEWISSHE